MRRRSAYVAAFALMVLSLSSHEARAQYSFKAGTVEIQETWELVLGTPDVLNAGPQVFVYMGPAADDSDSYAWLCLNVRANPFAAGGIQAQAWDRFGNLLTQSTFGNTSQCCTAGEKITWTQSMKLSAGQVTYQVINATTTTWGSFSKGSGPAPITFNVSARSLSSYDPATSVKYSKVGWMPNTVQSMRLTSVKQLDASGKILQEDNSGYSVNLTAR
jgi:hypothetical protein